MANGSSTGRREIDSLIETLVAWDIAQQLDAFEIPMSPVLPTPLAPLKAAQDGVLFSMIVAVADARYIDLLALSLDWLEHAGDVPFEIILPCSSEVAGAVDALLNRFTSVRRSRTIPMPLSSSVGTLRTKALQAATGTFISFLDAGDCPVRGALDYLAPLGGEREVEIIYTDEDWRTASGSYIRPRLKTGWDPDAHFGRDHLGRLAFLRTDTIRRVGGYSLDHGLAALYDLHTRTAFAVGPGAIRHVPVVLCHRSVPSPASNEQASIDAYLQAAQHVAEAAARRCALSAKVSRAPRACFVNRIHWPLPDPPPLVSVLIPTRDRIDLLRRCVEGVLERTDYRNLELLILDNDSSDAETLAYFNELRVDPRVRVLPTPGSFNFSRINNEGAAQARGDVLLFLNNDIEIISPAWLSEMVSHAIRPDVGCVGARLLYGDRRVQHAGVVLQPGPLAMHVFRRREETHLGFDAQLAGTRSYAAVTAACLAVRREVFDRVGGFDQERLQVSFQDVDLCLKVEECGLRNVCTPFEPLLHLEGASRSASPISPEKAPRERREVMCLFYRWADRFEDDRAGHPSLKLDWERPERIVTLEVSDALTLAR